MLVEQAINDVSIDNKGDNLNKSRVSAISKGSKRGRQTPGAEEGPPKKSWIRWPDGQEVFFFLYAFFTQLAAFVLIVLALFALYTLLRHAYSMVHLFVFGDSEAMATRRSPSLHEDYWISHLAIALGLMVLMVAVKEVRKISHKQRFLNRDVFGQQLTQELSLIHI